MRWGHGFLVDIRPSLSRCPLPEDVMVKTLPKSLTCWGLIVLDFCGLMSRLLTALEIPLSVTLWGCPKSPVVLGVYCLIMSVTEPNLGPLTCTQ